MDNRESEKARQLTDELQNAALSLIHHLRTNNLRIRVEGTTPAVYITLSEGRSSYSAESINLQAEQAATPAVAHETPLSSCLARLRKVLAA